MSKANTPTIHHHPSFGFATSKQEAVLFVEAHHISHFPIVEEGLYKGSLRSEAISELDHDQNLSELEYDLELFSVTKEDNWFDILEQCSKYSTNMVPLIGPEKSYLGYYRFKDLLDCFSDTPFFSEKAVTLTIEKNSHKYSFSEITHIVESNHSTLLGIFISDTTSENTEIVLKINSEKINEVIQTFRRYDYEILSQHMEDSYTNELQERSNYLNKYLDI